MEEEGKRCPTTCSCNNLRWDTCQKQFNGAADMEAVTGYVIHRGCKPDLSDEGQEGVSKHMGP